METEVCRVRQQSSRKKVKTFTETLLPEILCRGKLMATLLLHPGPGRDPHLFARFACSCR